MLATVYLAVSWFVVDQSLVAKPKELTESPSDFGLYYEPVSFSPINNRAITLRGWWIPHQQSRGTIIWVHGLDSAKDGNLEFVATLHNEGYNC